jgi:hypothetical protein
MTIRKILASAIAAMTVLSLAAPVQAETRKQEMRRKETFSDQDAEKGQAHVKAAMTVPMETLLAKADIQHPHNMLQYGIGLYLGRPSATASMPKGEKEKLKAAYRALLDQYLTSSDKFGSVTFDEDAMLDNGDFWVYLAQHIGRPKERQPLNQAGAGVDSTGAATNVFMVDRMENEAEDFNLKTEPIIRRQIANAAITCSTTARSFARMKKAQTVDISETKLTAEKYAEMRVTAGRIYRTSYVLGVHACAGEANFMATADFASQNLGLLGGMKDDPTAQLVTLQGEGAPKLEE